MANTSTIKKYNRIARFYDLLSRGQEKRWFSKWKNQFFSPLKGSILEVGIGTGKSIDLYFCKGKVALNRFIVQYLSMSSALSSE